MQSKAELAAIRKQRKAQRQAANAQATPPTALPQNDGTYAKAPPTAASPLTLTATLLAEESSGGKHATDDTAKPPVSEVAVAEPPSNQPPKPEVHGVIITAELPKGFFDDKKSDALAHGERLRTPKDDAHDMDVFQREVEHLEEQRLGQEAQDAEVAAERAAALEEFESG